MGQIEIWKNRHSINRGLDPQTLDFYLSSLSPHLEKDKEERDVWWFGRSAPVHMIKSAFLVSYGFRYVSVYIIFCDDHIMI